MTIEDNKGIEPYFTPLKTGMRMSIAPVRSYASTLGVCLRIW